MPEHRGQELRIVAGDLHIHSCLSPCGTLDMTPIKIINEACEKGLRMLAITDHNSAENTPAVTKAGFSKGVFVIPGIEITTNEEVHILGLFPEVELALSMQEIVYRSLQPGENNEEFFGVQVVANEYDEVERINKRLLLGATSIPLGKVVDAIHERQGLAIAAHIDRESFSIIGQLGFIPQGLKLDALEVSRHLPMDKAKKRFSEYEAFPFVTSSDAHTLEEVGANPTWFNVAAPNFEELRLALQGEEGRKTMARRSPC